MADRDLTLDEVAEESVMAWPTERDMDVLGELRAATDG